MRATPTNANRMLATLSCMFAVAELWEIRPNGSNPCRKIKHFREERRERFLSDEEYGRLGEVLREVEREGSERPSAIAAIRLLMLTGCRKGEILTLRWEYVDLDRGELRLRDGKTGGRVVPLGPEARTILAGLSPARTTIPGLSPAGCRARTSPIYRSPGGASVREPDWRTCEFTTSGILVHHDALSLNYH